MAISEAAPLAEALGAGWVSVRIDQDRKGAKRTFSRQSLEYLTINRPPAHVPALQVPLW